MVDLAGWGGFIVDTGLREKPGTDRIFYGSDDSGKRWYGMDIDNSSAAVIKKNKKDRMDVLSCTGWLFGDKQSDT